MIKAIINRPSACPVSDAAIKRVISFTARYVKKVRGMVAITFVSNRFIRELNRRERGLDKPTDVLSFAWGENGGSSGGYLGELYLSYQYIVPQAKRFGVTAEAECIRMIVHGMLHLAGFDHDSAFKAKKMFGLQEKILRACLISRFRGEIRQFRAKKTKREET